MEKRKSYDLKFKLSVIEHAEKTSNREAGRKFQIDESMVRRWHKTKEQIEKSVAKGDLSKRKRIEGAGRKPCLGSIEEALMEKICNEREEKQNVSCKLITLWALELARENGLTSFGASRGWLVNFMCRFSLSVRRRTATRQMSPKDDFAKIANFVKFCENQRNIFNFPLHSIAYMDETLIWAGMPNETNVERAESLNVPSKATAHERLRITVCLCIKADGSKLKPFIVIPGKNVDVSTPGAVVRCSPNGWMNEHLTYERVTEILGSLAFVQRLLVWDSFKCHISDHIKEEIHQRKTTMAVIPGGCTGLLQAFDVFVSKPFKCYFRELYDDWFRKGMLECTEAGVRKSPNLSLQMQWIVEAWRNIEKETIIKSFEACGITTSDPKKIHCMTRGDAIEEALESNVEFIPKPTEADERDEIVDEKVSLDIFEQQINNENTLEDYEIYFV